MFDFLKLKNEIASVAGKIRAVRKEAEELKRRREDLATAPATREDVVQLMMAQVDEAAARYPARLLESINATTTCGKASSTGPDGMPIPVSVFMARQHHQHAATVRDVQDSLCFVLQGQLKAALERAVKAMPWPDGAQPVEGRAAAINKLDREIAALEAEESALREAATAAGLVI